MTDLDRWRTPALTTLGLLLISVGLWLLLPALGLIAGGMGVLVLEYLMTDDPTTNKDHV